MLISARSDHSAQVRRKVCGVQWAPPPACPGAQQGPHVVRREGWHDALVHLGHGHRGHRVGGGEAFPLQETAEGLEHLA